MRPRHYAAENNVSPLLVRITRLASMRPRHYAAENHCVRESAQCLKRGFNEAAALRRGKRVARRARHHLGDAASMRPRHYAAENYCLRCSP